jgi:Carboxypeptidase regulatory-like domain
MRKRTATLLLSFVFCVGQVAGQSTDATLSGRVSDATDAAVPATLTLNNTQTGIVRTSTANEAGIYQFTNVQPGTYRLTAAVPGFETAIYSTLTLEVAAKVRADFRLRPAGPTETVEVTADLASPLAATTSSLGGVINGARIRDLPVAARDAMDLVETQAGKIGDNLNGARRGTLNITRDGINVMNQFRNDGVNSVIFESTDIVQEVRVVTSPADAEFARGSGQIQISTRAGTNEFHGSVFESLRNTALNANNWFNNQRSSPRDALNRNQFGGRFGGPVVRNKTFFHFLYDGQREVRKNAVTSNTFTETARQGLFRFFPGVQNASVTGNVPTVDLNGNPVKPASATGELQTVSVFNRDPNRPGRDPTGAIQKFFALMPLPNNFRSGEGLNVAGYTWSRRETSDRDQFNTRVDHHFNDRHRLNFTWTHESRDAVNGYAPQTFPQAPGGSFVSSANFYSLQLTSTLSPRLLNEFNVGAQRRRNTSYAAFELEGKTQYPTSGGVRYVANMMPTGIANVIPLNGPQADFSPLTVWRDNLSWTKGRHTFKAGGEIRRDNFDAYVEAFRMPRTVFGAGGAAVTGISNIPNILQNQAAAQNLLIALSGSLASVRQEFYSLGIANPIFFSPNEGQHANGSVFMRESSFFFKDDWKIRPDLTLNLGLRHEYYSVPWYIDAYTGERGQLGVVGGSNGLFGWSGSGFADMYRPGPQKGPLTAFEYIGRGSPHPERHMYDDDYNNFAPAIGLNWSLPYFGKGKTILRTGYSVGYERLPLFLVGNVAGEEPGSISLATFTSAQYLDLSRINLPLTPIGKPFDVVPLTDRVQTASAYDSHLRTPYVQNWNLAIQRELPGGMSVDVRYVGNKGTKLIRQANINEVNIFESGILDAFLAIQAGGNSPLLDRMLNGLNVAANLGPVNGSTVTASQSLRTNATTSAFLANNNVGAFANYLNTTTNFTNIAGELIRRAGLPENLIVANPQFATANLAGNFANSTHHAMQVDWIKRSSHGWTVQSNYTWGRTLGETPGDGSGFIEGGFRNLRDRHVEKRLETFHRTHVFRANGLLELPFGPAKRFVNGNASLLSRLVERWQFGAVFNVFSGEPIGFVSQTTSLNQNVNNTPDLVGALPNSFGKVTYDPAGVSYFQGLQLTADPAILGITSLQGLNTRSTMLAVAGSDGKLIAVNSTPGRLGSMSPTFLEGPGTIRFDMTVVKRIRIAERTEFEFRADAINLLNRANFASPDTNINSQTFGRITETNGGNRIVELHARINF